MLAFKEKMGLFDDFEVNRQPFWPVIGRLLGGSAALHLVLALCVIFIPSVRNALSITAMFSDAGFVDRDYARTHVSDDGSEIIELTTEKFRYPDGYFLMDQQPMPSPFPISPITPSFVPSSSFPATAVATPSPAPVVSPSPPAAIASASPGAKAADPKASPSPKAADDKEIAKAQKELDQASKATGIELAEEGEINKRPFKDLADHFIELKNAGKLDVNQAFEIVIDSELNEDGKLKNAKVTKKGGDQTLVDLAQRLIEAMNESGVLFYLKRIHDDNPSTKVVFTIKQDKDEVIATVESEVTSVDSARKLSNGFGLLLALGAKTREGKNEEILLKKTTVSPDGKRIIFNLTLPHQTVVDIIKKGTEPVPAGSPS